MAAHERGTRAFALITFAFFVAVIVADKESERNARQTNTPSGSNRGTFGRNNTIGHYDGEYTIDTRTIYPRVCLTLLSHFSTIRDG